MQICTCTFKTDEIYQLSTVALALYNIGSELDFRVCFLYLCFGACSPLLLFVSVYVCLAHFLSAILILMLFSYSSIKADAALFPHFQPYLVPVNIFLHQGWMRTDPWGTISVHTEKHPSQTRWHALHRLNLLIGHVSKLIGQSKTKDKVTTDRRWTSSVSLQVLYFVIWFIIKLTISFCHGSYLTKITQMIFFPFMRRFFLIIMDISK